MMTSEKVAREKWCPFARTESSEGAGINRPSHIYRNDDDAGVHFNTRCIASDCMAWRAERVKPDNWQPGEDLPPGRCGLAGPE
jgi:hypothetical protein